MIDENRRSNRCQAAKARKAWACWRKLLTRARRQQFHVQGELAVGPLDGRACGQVFIRWRGTASSADTMHAVRRKARVRERISEQWKVANLDEYRRMRPAGGRELSISVKTKGFFFFFSFMPLFALRCIRVSCRRAPGWPSVWGSQSGWERRWVDEGTGGWIQRVDGRSEEGVLL